MDHFGVMELFIGFQLNNKLCQGKFPEVILKIRVADLDELSRFGSGSGSDPKKNKKILILLNFDRIIFNIQFIIST